MTIGNLIHNRYTEEDVYSFYIGERVTTYKKYRSPFREEQNPSLTFMYRNTDGKLVWTDWGDVNIRGPQNVFEFVKQIYNCSFESALEHILDDLGSNQAFTIEISRKSLKSPLNRLKSKIPFKIKDRPFDNFDLNFWSQFGITIDILSEYDVFALEYFAIGDRIVKQHINESPFYAYKLVDNGEIYYKIYDPFTKDRDAKWRYNGKENILQGFNQLPLSGEFVIVTKSLKDVMSLRAMDIVSVALQSESTSLKTEVYYKLASRFDKVIVFFDNDETGVKFAKRISEDYEIPMIFIPENEFGIKDISDYIKRNGLKEGETLMLNLLATVL